MRTGRTGEVVSRAPSTAMNAAMIADRNAASKMDFTKRSATGEQSARTLIRATRALEVNGATGLNGVNEATVVTGATGAIGATGVIAKMVVVSEASAETMAIVEGTVVTGTETGVAVASVVSVATASIGTGTIDSTVATGTETGIEATEEVMATAATIDTVAALATATEQAANADRSEMVEPVPRKAPRRTLLQKMRRPTAFLAEPS